MTEPTVEQLKQSVVMLKARAFDNSERIASLEHRLGEADQGFKAIADLLELDRTEGVTINEILKVIQLGKDQLAEPE